MELWTRSCPISLTTEYDAQGGRHQTDQDPRIHKHLLSSVLGWNPRASLAFILFYFIFTIYVHFKPLLDSFCFCVSTWSSSAVQLLSSHWRLPCSAGLWCTPVTPAGEPEASGVPGTGGQPGHDFSSCHQLGMVVYTFNPRTKEAEAGRSLSSKPSWIHSEFQAS